MFTGLVERLATVAAVREDGTGGRVLTVSDGQIASSLALGESVAVNGACLTVTAIREAEFEFQIGPETIRRTNLGELVAGDRVNLERALRVGDRLGGHFVLGHVDCVGRILSRETNGEWEMVWFTCPEGETRYMVEKGSIAVDGISLTLVEVLKDRFLIMLIPHTLTHTTLGFKKPDSAVNIEVDMLAKHVEKLLQR